ncbi:MAG: DMT family transporter [Planctomycetota bacterium]
MTDATARAGLWYMAQSVFWFAVMSLLVKIAGRSMPTMQVVFARACVTLLLSSLLLWRARLYPVGRRPKLLLLRGLFGSSALICFYLAVVHLPLAEATVLQQTSQISTALLAAWVLRERLELRVLLALLTCLCGVALIAEPSWLTGAEIAGGLDWRYVLVGFGGSFLSACAYVTVRTLGRTEDPNVVVFWFPVVTVTLSAPFAVAQWTWPDARGWALLVAIGVVTQFGQMAMTRGFARAPAAKAAMVNYLQIVVAAVFGIVFFDTWPDGWSLAGILVIVASLFLSLRPRAT